MMKKPYTIEPTYIDEVKPASYPLSDDVMFINGALRAALNSPPKVRKILLDDIKFMLGCSSSELDFLFTSQNDHMDNKFYDFPDAARRRLVLLEHYLSRRSSVST